MKTFFAATIALSMLAAPAMAAPHDAARNGHPAVNQNHQGQYNQYKPQPPKPQAHKPQPKQQYSYNGKKYDAVRGPAWNAPKGYNAHRNWNRGQKLPTAYRNKAYVVDYRAYRLKQPPRGYQWVRNNNNVYLVSMNNGLISQIVLNLFY